MSSRRVVRMLGLLSALALVFGAFAGTASAKKLSAKHKAAVRHQLLRQVKKNPRLIRSASFIRKASLVNFTLPVTIRLQQKTDPLGNTVPNAGNRNHATIDLGPSLGQRTIGLGGSLPAEIKFHDAFDGGALGNVDLTLLPGGSQGLTTTSIPLLANSAVTGAAYGSGGCVGWAAINDPFGLAPGVDDPASLTSLDDPGLNNLGDGGIGPNDNNPSDAVLRTGPLSLQIAAPQTGVTLPGNPGDSPTVSIGSSGGQANLFGVIPGRSTQIDVTANLTTKINSLLREVDPSDTNSPNDPAMAFNCRQAWTGYVQNYLTGIHLNGSLSISPAITADGKLRIAKASLTSVPGESDPVTVAACLMPQTSLAQDTGANPPIDSANTNAAPTDACNTALDPVLSTAPPNGLGVQPLAAPGGPYTTTNDGSQVAVSGNLTVDNITAEVLIGGNQ